MSFGVFFFLRFIEIFACVLPRSRGKQFQENAEKAPTN